ncbi:MAG: hypothetical protein V1859_03920 [archaeon]
METYFLPEKKKKEFNLLIGGINIEFSLSDLGNGIYSVVFEAPQNPADYSVVLTADGEESASVALKVKPFLLNTFFYSENNSKNLSSVIYLQSGGTMSGIGVESASGEFLVAPGVSAINASALSSTVIFYTNNNLERLSIADKKLKKNSFTTSINPSFGYSAETIYDLAVMLLYGDDIILVAGQKPEFAKGTHNILLKGAGKQSGKSKISIETREAQIDNSVFQYG